VQSHSFPARVPVFFQHFAVLIFLGQVPNDPSQWHTAPTFVGSHHAFVNSAASQCDNCGREQADLVVESFVHSTWPSLSGPVFLRLNPACGYPLSDAEPTLARPVGTSNSFHPRPLTGCLSICLISPFRLMLDDISISQPLP
jgi:hypothetical protein